MYFGVDESGKGYSSLPPPLALSLSLFLSVNTLTHTHTHTDTVGEMGNVKFLTIVRKCVEVFFLFVCFCFFGNLFFIENKDGGSVIAN